MERKNKIRDTTKMIKLTDADKLMVEIERIYMTYFERSYDQAVHDLYNAVRRRIKWYCNNNDVVIIRCKDCEYSILPGKLTQRYGLPDSLTCKNANSPCHCRRILGTDYCPYGKRRDNNG